MKDEIVKEKTTTTERTDTGDYERTTEHTVEKEVPEKKTTTVEETVTEESYTEED